MKSKRVSTTARPADERIYEKDVVNTVWNAKAKNLEFKENGKSNLILFFTLSLI